MIPWIIIAVVAVPLVVIGFMSVRRTTPAAEVPASDGASSEQTEQEFARAEAYEAAWHEEDKAKYHDERLP